MENKIIDKINKLLKLSQSSNIEEAMSAYDKAHSLLKEYNLKIEDIKEKPEIEGIELSSGKKNECKWKTILLNGIAKSNYCALMISKQYETKYKIYGREYNVESTKVMFDYLCEAIERLTKQESKRIKNNDLLNRRIFNANSFRLGAVENLIKRLNEKNQQQCMALVPISKESEKALYQDNPNVRSVSTKVKFEQASLRSGYAKANDISLNSQVSSTKMTRGYLNG